MPCTVVFNHYAAGAELELELLDRDGDIVNGDAPDAMTEPDGKACRYEATVEESLSGWFTARVRDSHGVLYTGRVKVDDDGDAYLIDDPSAFDVTSTADMIAEKQDEQDNRFDELDQDAGQIINDLAAMTLKIDNVKTSVDGTLKPTVPGRTLNVDTSGKADANASVDLGDITIKNVTVEGLTSNAIDQIVEAANVTNVVVSPVTASTPPDLRQSTIYLRLFDTSQYEIQEFTGTNGQPLQLALYEHLELIFETRGKSTLEVIPLTDMPLINDGRGLRFAPSAAVVGAETSDSSRHLWALRDPDDVIGSDGSGRVLAGGDCVVRRFATKREE